MYKIPAFVKRILNNKVSFFVSAFMCLCLLGGCGSGSLLSSSVYKSDATAKARQDKLNADYKYLQAEFMSADKFLDRGELSEAQSGYERILKRFPSNAKASEGIKKIELIRSHERLLEEADALAKSNDLEGAKSKLSLIISENPSDQRARKKLMQFDASASTESLRRMLSVAFHKPISIDFQNANLKQVFNVIGQTAGLNFIFDKDVKLDQQVTITLNNTTVEAAIYSMLTINQLEQQVMDEKTLLIYPNNSAKAKDYQQTVVKSFMLTNARAKGVADSLKTILKSRDVVVDEKLNMLIVRDSPEALSMIDKIIALQDQPEPEVMLELEVLEVSRDRLLQLGITPPGNVGLTLLSPNAKLSDLANIRSNSITATIDPAGIKAIGTDSDFDILASPRVRVINREKAKILIGNKVPTITSTLIPGVSGTSTAETISYIDVGLKLEIEPTIYLNSDVSIRVSLEVSSIVDKLVSKLGSVAYTVGNRNASTVLRLKDGENQILAGLINSETDRTINKFPGLGDLPLLGHLFKSQSNDDKKTEILLSITPRLVRNIQRQEANLSEFLSGTDNSLRVRPEFKVSNLEPAPQPASVSVPAVTVVPNLATTTQAVPPPQLSITAPTPTPTPPIVRPAVVVSPNSVSPEKVIQAPNVADRTVTPVIIQKPVEDITPNTLAERSVDEKPNKKKTNPQPKAGINKKTEDKGNEKKKVIAIDKVSPETLDFIEKVLKPNESK